MLKVNIFYILLGLFLGFFIIYVTTPQPKVVLKYPTIENIQNTTYVDNAGNCFKYYAKEVPCGQNFARSPQLTTQQNTIVPVSNKKIETFSNHAFY